MKAITFTSFSAASRRMRWPIKADCTGEPPGELMASATALAPRMSKARLSSGATLSMERPRLPKRPPEAMTPDSRTTGTTGPRRKRSFNQPSMGGNVPAATSEGKRASVAQDGLGLVGVSAAWPMQREGWRVVPRQPVGPAGAHQDACRGGQALHRDVAPPQAAEMAEDLVQAVAAMDDEQGACRFRRRRGHHQPARQVGAGFDSRQRLGGVGRRVSDCGGEVRRVGHAKGETGENGPPGPGA